MNTPIIDFVRAYARTNALRLHMPGHKGVGPLGVEALDITEIEGADSLYEASGVIRESEQNASRLFGCETLFSTEGSSLCIRAMVHLAALHGRRTGKKPLIAAGRNAHKTFLSAAALLDLDVMWLTGSEDDSYLACRIDADVLDGILSKAEDKPFAVYLTSPDYLGNVNDIRRIADVCHKHGVLLLVDNAHGAYLKFLPEPMHPIDLGADMCCDSAHKTLPVLTGGAYLHISPDAPEMFAAQAKNALALFGSTSPSYLIMQSLDAANVYLTNYPAKLAGFADEVQKLKNRLTAHGYALTGSEPLKLTVCTKPWGYTGRSYADLLLEKNIVCEFSDPDFTVMMLTPETGTDGLKQLEAAMLAIPAKPTIGIQPPVPGKPERVLPVREAIFSPSEIIPAAESAGRILANPSVGCPPAVPIVVCGERIDEAAVRCFAYYGIESCAVVSE